MKKFLRRDDSAPHVGPILITGLIVYFFILTFVLVLIPKLLPVVILFLIVFAILSYFTLNRIPDIFLFFIAITPLIQKFNFAGIKAGDFYISLHMVFLFFLILGFLYYYLREKSRVPVGFNTIEKAMFWMFVSTIPSLIFPAYLPVNHVKRYLLFYTGIIEPLVFYFILREFILSIPGYSERLLKSLVLTAIAAGLVALWELSSFNFNLTSIFLNRMRFGFGYQNPNLFGIHSALLLPLTLYFVLKEDTKPRRALYFICFIILFTLSMLTFNRGTFIVSALQLFLLFLFVKKSRPFVSILFVIFLMVMALNNKLVILYFARFFAGNDAKMGALIDNSALYRLEAWGVGLKTLVLYPLGVGAGGFQYVWEKYGQHPLIYLGTPHHLFLSVGVDYGVFTMIIFLTLLIIIIYKLINSLTKTKTNQSLYLSLIISFVGYVVYGMITDGELSHLTGFTIPTNGYTLILYAIIAYISTRNSTKSNA